MVGRAVYGGEGGSCRRWFQWKRGCARQENGVVVPSPQLIPQGWSCWLPALLPAAPCRHCVSIGVGARWELGVCVQLLPSVLIPVCAGAAVEGWGSCRNVLVELYKLMLHCSSMQGPAAGFEQADQSPCSTISLHNHPQGPKAAPAPCQAALSSHKYIFIVSPVHRRGPRSPHFCVDKCIQCIRMAVALLLYVKSI